MTEAARTQIESVASLWLLLFPQGARVDPCLGFETRELAPPAAMWTDRPSDAPAAVLIPWLSTPAAEARALTLGREYGAPPPAIVRKLHDKAFSTRVAHELRLGPADLTPCLEVLEPEELLAADASRNIESRVQDWPAPYRRSFTLKPRWGTSGRGRVAGSDGRLPEASVRALPTLAARGGAILEPWLERVQDLSVQLYVRGPESIQILGTTRQLLDRSGLYRGNAGVLESGGELSSGSRFDEEARTGAVQVARAAANVGFHGYCGVDSFLYRDAEGMIRPRTIVEFNARVTSGTVALTAVRAVRSSAGIGGRSQLCDALRSEDTPQSGCSRRSGDSPRLEEPSPLDWMFLVQDWAGGGRNMANNPDLDAQLLYERGNKIPLLAGVTHGPVVVLRDLSAP